MCRHGHHRAGAVVHQHVVGDPHRHRLPGQRVNRTQTCIHTGFFRLGHVSFGHRGLFALGDKGSEIGVIGGQRQADGMLGGQAYISHPKERIGASGVHLDARVTGDRTVEPKGQLDAAALANPVALHGAHGLGPAVELVEIGQQFFGVGGDADKPLGNFAALNQGTGAPSASIDDLLVSQHRLIHRIPVDRGHLFVDQTLFVEPGKEPLLPAIVFRAAGRDLAVPVKAEAQGLELLTHVLDVAVGPFGRRRLVGDSGVLRRQAKGIPAHGVQHIAAEHPLIAGNGIGDRVIAHMAHMQFAAGVGEHGQAIEFLALEAVPGGKAALFLPEGLRIALDILGVVVVFHGVSDAA